MRTGFHLTEQEVARRMAEGYGSGVYSQFKSFHQVDRNDFSSQGLSAIEPQRGKSAGAHQLSDIESRLAALASMLADIDDIRWQVLLEWSDHPNELVAYLEDLPFRHYRGTADIAAALGCTHPLLRERDGSKSLWPMTTDLVITLRPRHGRRRILAISCKDRHFDALKKSIRRSLRIERHYWIEQGHEWLLFNPETVSLRYLEAVFRGSAFARGTEPQGEEAISRAAQLATRCAGSTFATCVRTIQRHFQCDDARARALFWQSVWAGKLLIELEDSLWFSNCMRLISHDAFWQANPLAARRSAWRD